MKLLKKSFITAIEDIAFDDKNGYAEINVVFDELKYNNLRFWSAAEPNASMGQVIYRTTLLIEINNIDRHSFKELLHDELFFISDREDGKNVFLLGDRYNGLNFVKVFKTNQDITIYEFEHVGCMPPYMLKKMTEIEYVGKFPCIRELKRTITFK